MPLKHALKKTFKFWTTIVIKHHIDIDKDLAMNFKMNSLKSQFCEWLHQACKQVKQMQIMIVKRWETIELTKVLGINF
jgi:hypothetical protein